MHYLQDNFWMLKKSFKNVISIIKKLKLFINICLLYNSHQKKKKIHLQDSKLTLVPIKRHSNCISYEPNTEIKVKLDFYRIYRYLCPFGWTQKKILEDKIYISAYSAVSTVYKSEEITNLCLSSHFIHWKDEKSHWDIIGGLGTDVSGEQDKRYLSEDSLCEVIQMGAWQWHKTPGHR